MNVEVTRDRRKALEEPRIEILGVEMRIRRARQNRVRTLEGQPRIAVVIDGAQSDVALADIEHDGGR
jgi:hypothetical protein